MIRFLVIVFLMAATASCAPGQTKMKAGPNSEGSHVVECLDEEKKCYPLAKKLCPKGYVIADSKHRAVMNWQGFEVENTLKFTLQIECKE